MEKAKEIKINCKKCPEDSNCPKFETCSNFGICRMCDGEGILENHYQDRHGDEHFNIIKCKVCHGTGAVKIY